MIDTPLRVTSLAALPAVIVASSPQRVGLSIALAGVYLCVGILLNPLHRSNRRVVLYALVAAAIIALSLLHTLLRQDVTGEEQRYGVDKAFYFLFVVLPMSVGAAMLVRQSADLKPAAAVYIIVGVGLATATVLLRNNAILGEGRYTWQGNLIAIAFLLLLQGWVIRRYWIIVALGIVCIAGISFGTSRQSAIAAAVGLGGSAVYWVFADWRGRRRDANEGITSNSRIAPRSLKLLLLIGVFAAASVVFVGLTVGGGEAFVPPWSITSAAGCDCVTGRILALQQSAGDRDVLVGDGWQFFLDHPLVGNGLGSFINVVPGYSYPHNLPLEIADESGVVGLLVLFAPLAIGGSRLFLVGARARDRSIGGLIAIVTAFTVIGSFSGDLPSARGFWIFALIALKLSVGPGKTARSPSLGPERILAVRDRA